MSTQQIASPRDVIKKHLPRVEEWLHEREIPLDDVAGFGIRFDTVRDFDREIKENSKWKLWKHGEYVTVTIRLSNGLEMEHRWKKDVWNRVAP